jgi:hypothetical protein
MKAAAIMQDSQPLSALYAPPQAALADRPGEAPPGSMRLEYQVATRDLLRFRLLHTVTSKRTYIATLIFIPITSFLVGGFHGVGNFLYRAGLGCVGFLAFMLVFQTVVTLLQRKSTYLTRHAIELREDGIYDETIHSRCLYYWKSVLRVDDRPGYVAIYVGAQAAHIVPDHAFGGEVLRERFLVLARQRMAAARKTR